jgi:hypothetical protein
MQKNTWGIVKGTDQKPTKQKKTRFVQRISFKGAKKKGKSNIAIQRR